MTVTRRALIGSVPAIALAAPAVVRAAGPVEISFLFPVAVGGPITKIIDDYARDFEAENPAIKVRPVYAGSYVDTLTKAQTQLKAGDKPTMAVLLAVDAFTLIDQTAHRAVRRAGADAGGQDLARQLLPGLPRQRPDRRPYLWSVPFQRSTIVLYYNKDAFKQAGLDPEAPPATWAQHAEFAAKLTQRQGDTVQRWGTEIPGTGFTYWLLPGAYHRSRRHYRQCRRHRNLFRQPRSRCRFALLARPLHQIPGAPAGTGRLGHHAA